MRVAPDPFFKLSLSCKKGSRTGSATKEALVADCWHKDWVRLMDSPLTRLSYCHIIQAIRDFVSGSVICDGKKQEIVKSLAASMKKESPHTFCRLAICHGLQFLSNLCSFASMRT